MSIKLTSNRKSYSLKDVEVIAIKRALSKYEFYLKRLGHSEESSDQYNIFCATCDVLTMLEELNA